jgi:hypothetical protein
MITGNACRAALLAALVTPATLMAQTSLRSNSPSPGEPPPLLVPDAGARLKPARWTYVTRLMTGGTPQQLGFRTLIVEQATFKGAPAWLVVDRRELHTVTLAESLYVRRADLEPLHRVAHSPRSGVVAEYAHDSIRTTFGGEQGTVSVAMANQPGLLANFYMLELLMGTVPLNAGWRSSARLAAITPEQSGIVLIESRAVGEETVMTPVGTFDCWLVETDVGASRQRLWIRKSDGVVVKERIPVLGMVGEMELLLVKGDTARKQEAASRE